MPNDGLPVSIDGQIDRELRDSIGRIMSGEDTRANIAALNDLSVQRLRRAKSSVYDEARALLTELVGA